MNAPEQTPRPSLQSRVLEAGGATRPQHFAMMETSMCETYAQCTKIIKNTTVHGIYKFATQFSKLRAFAGKPSDGTNIYIY